MIAEDSGHIFLNSKLGKDYERCRMLSKIGKIEFLVLVALISLIAAQSFVEIKADSIVLALSFEGNAKGS